MIDKGFLALAVLGIIAALCVHAAAWLGFAAGFPVTFALVGGCLLVWWRALRAARTAFQTHEATALWRAVTARCPGWVKLAHYSLLFNFMVYWAWTIYVVARRAREAEPRIEGSLVFGGGIGLLFPWRRLRLGL